jgi:hypothetical protein
MKIILSLLSALIVSTGVNAEYLLTYMNTKNPNGPRLESAISLSKAKLDEAGSDCYYLIAQNISGSVGFIRGVPNWDYQNLNKNCPLEAYQRMSEEEQVLWVQNLDAGFIDSSPSVILNPIPELSQESNTQSEGFPELFAVYKIVPTDVSIWIESYKLLIEAQKELLPERASGALAVAWGDDIRNFYVMRTLDKFADAREASLHGEAERVLTEFYGKTRGGKIYSQLLSSTGEVRVDLYKTRQDLSRLAPGQWSE